MKKLSADPYAGARRAYQVLNPESSDDDWETWVALRTTEEKLSFDDFGALAKLCRDAMGSPQQLEAPVAHHICFAGGWFEAMDSVTYSLSKALPTSPSAPQHRARYRASLVNTDAQFS